MTEELRAQLNEPMPKKAIAPHPAKSYLSTIKAIYVVERLNDVFGIGGWNLETSIIKDTGSYILVTGRITTKKDINTPYQYGGSKYKEDDIGDGYKSAVTDCMSKCASYLEIGLEVFKGEVTHKQSKNTAQASSAPSQEPPRPPMPDDPFAEQGTPYVLLCGCGAQLEDITTSTGKNCKRCPNWKYQEWKDQGKSYEHITVWPK